MKRAIFNNTWLSLAIGLTLLAGQLGAQDTFSIVAVDITTGEVGSAGASCVGSSSYYPHGAAVLSDVIPNVGGIHTQASYLAANQNNAHNMMMSGSSPQEIIDWLINNDAGGDPSVRQYGIVDLNSGDPRSAAFSGVNCLNYKNDTAGLAYSIQGNILLGQEIIDSMQSRFLNTSGTLAERLMASLQGANVIGADTRCASPYNSSSLSAFIRVAQPENSYDSLYLDLWMAYPQSWSGAVPVDPIDSLQTLFNDWQTHTTIPGKGDHNACSVTVRQSESGEISFNFSHCPNNMKLNLMVYNLQGKMITVIPVNKNIEKMKANEELAKGIYLYRVTTNNQLVVVTGKFFKR